MNNGGYILHTDGSCLHNPGPGGVGICLSFPEHLNLPDETSYRGFQHSTNNRMELMAGVMGLKLLRERMKKLGRHPITWLTDSKYIADNIYHIRTWRKGNQWKTSTGEPVLNVDLWKDLEAVRSSLGVSPIWVSREENKTADKLAKYGANNPTHTDFGFNTGKVGASVKRTRNAPTWFKKNESLEIRIYKGDGQISRKDSRCKIRFEIVQDDGSITENKHYIYASMEIYNQLHRHHLYVVQTVDGEITRIVKNSD